MEDNLKFLAVAMNILSKDKNTKPDTKNYGVGYSNGFGYGGVGYGSGNSQGSGFDNGTDGLVMNCINGYGDGSGDGSGYCKGAGDNDGTCIFD